jgi:hypothetical protein
VGRSLVAGVVGLLVGIAVGLTTSLFVGSDSSDSSSEAVSGVARSNDDRDSAAERVSPSAQSAPIIEGDAMAKPDAVNAEREAVPTAANLRGDEVITGTVLDPQGKGVAGVAIRASFAPASSSASSRRGLGLPPMKSFDEEVSEAIAGVRQRRAGRIDTTTADDGTFRLSNLVEGRYTIEAGLEGFVIEGQGSTWVQTGGAVQFIATPAIAVPLTVLLPDGRAAARASLHVQVERRTHHESFAASNPFLRLSAGSYKLRALVADGADLAANGLKEPAASEWVTVTIVEAVTPVELKLVTRLGVRGRVKPHPELLGFDGLRAGAVPLASDAEFDPSSESPSQDPRSTVSVSGGKFELMDLAAGRYAVVVQTGNEDFLLHEVIELQSGIAEVELDLADLDASRFLTCRVLDPDGQALAGVDFRQTLRSKNGTRTSSPTELPRRDGSYWLSFGADAAKALAKGDASTKFELTAQTSSFGSRTVEVAPGAKSVEISFREPAFLNVTVAGYVGSGMEGRLRVALQSGADQEGRYFGGRNDQFDSKGQARLGPNEPGSYTVVLTAEDRDGDRFRNPEVARQDLVLASGENSVMLTIGALHDLEVTVVGVDVGGHVSLSRTTTSGEDHVDSQEVENGKVTFSSVAPGEYRVQYFDQAGLFAVASLMVPAVTRITLEPKSPNCLQVVVWDQKGALAAAGFVSGDLVIAIDDTEFTDMASLMTAMTTFATKEKSKLKILRAGRTFEIEFDGRKLRADQDALGGHLSPTAR